MFDFLVRAYRRRFGADKAFYAVIYDMFGFVPNNIELYKLALIHKSASVALEDGSHINNERLEFLGDAVIESITSDYLFIEFPDRDEGFMTQVRSKIVSRQSLNNIAALLGLDKHVISTAIGNTSQKHIYGDAFEAMMGAIYLDKGYDFANRLLINDIYGRYLSLDDVLKSETDFKSRLIEWCQKNHYSIEFRTGHESGSSHAHPTFHCAIYVDGMVIGHGTGDSKKAAEQNAAFSVSQATTAAISDESSARILDRLDKLSSVQNA
ncbi:MAG: ribonuclease III [Alistipes sp.]|nr:ribonuclease III [Alistipes sp.]